MRFLLLDAMDFKIFQTSNFLASRSHDRNAQVVETEMHLFFEEMNHHTVACCAYKAEHH
jgi:hypothetical protein